MKITGAAPKIAILTMLFLIITVVADNLTSFSFKITNNHYSILIIISVVLIAAGAVIVLITGRELITHFREEKLMKDGMYKIFRNPMYAAYLIFIIPGICLLFNSWLVLTAVLVNFIFLKIFIREEYKYLEEKFGDQYREYLKTVWIKFL